MLTETDINRIAEAVVRKLREVEGLKDDAAFEASLPVAEQKRRAREEMKRQDRARKATERRGVADGNSVVEELSEGVPAAPVGEADVAVHGVGGHRGGARRLVRQS